MDDYRYNTLHTASPRRGSAFDSQATGSLSYAAPSWAASGSWGTVNLAGAGGFGSGAERTRGARPVSRPDARFRDDAQEAGRRAADAPRGRGDAAARSARRASADRGRTRSRRADGADGTARAARRRVTAGDRPERAVRADRRAEARGAEGRPSARRTNFMRYATDNRVVSALYGFLTGPYRLVFYAAVIAAVAFGIYFPVRDLYTAYRTHDILERQLAVREEYNDSLQGDVDKYLSVDGIEEAAREQLGLVMPGEQAIDVVGLGDDGSTGSDAGAADGGTADGAAADSSDTGADAASNAGASDGTAGAAAQDGSASDGAAQDAEAASRPTTSAEVEAAEQAVADDAPWYIKLLDGFFFYQGVDGQKVASSGS